MLQTETKKSRRQQCEEYVNKHVINKELEWLIEHGEIRESVYFRGATGDRYSMYVGVKRNKNIIDLHTVYFSYNYGTSVGSYIGSIRGYILTLGQSGNAWYSGSGYTFKQLMRQGVMSINHPWTIRFCRSAYLLKLSANVGEDGYSEFSPWKGMKIDLKNGTLVGKPVRKALKEYRTAKETDARIRKANALSNKNNTEALERYRKANGDTKAARNSFNNGNFQRAEVGAGTENINWDMIPIDDVFKHRNVTLRSNILEHYGINKVLETLEYDTVDIAFIDGREYKLLDVVIPDNSTADRRSEKCLYLQMLNPSTGESHFEGIANVGGWQGPKEATVKEALRWRDDDQSILRGNSISNEGIDSEYIVPTKLT